MRVTMEKTERFGLSRPRFCRSRPLVSKYPAMKWMLDNGHAGEIVEILFLRRKGPGIRLKVAYGFAAKSTLLSRMNGVWWGWGWGMAMNVYCSPWEEAYELFKV